jgi:hypothetical protein
LGYRASRGDQVTGWDQVNVAKRTRFGRGGAWSRRRPHRHSEVGIVRLNVNVRMSARSLTAIQVQVVQWRLSSAQSRLLNQPLSKGEHHSQQRCRLQFVPIPSISVAKQRRPSSPVAYAVQCCSSHTSSLSLAVYLMRRHRHRRLKARIATGAIPPPEATRAVEPVVIPPDPAVVLGLRQPGERISPNDRSPSNGPTSTSPLERASFASIPPLPASAAKEVIIRPPT